MPGQAILKALMRELESFAILLKLPNPSDVRFGHYCESCLTSCVFRSVTADPNAVLVGSACVQ